MTREEIIEKLRAMEPELRARGITRMQMFGSRARGDGRPDSDLDLLIDIDPDAKFSLFDLAGVHVDLTESLGIETYATLARDSSQGLGAISPTTSSRSSRLRSEALSATAHHPYPSGHRRCARSSQVDEL